MSISNFLISKTRRCLFLPSHGRGNALPKDLKDLLRRRAGIWDLPELPGLGGPLEKDGAVALSQRRSAELVGLNKVWYGVNGATGLLQAALLSLARPNECVLMPRNIHRSIINACIIGQIKPVLFDIPFMEETGHLLPPDEDWINSIISDIRQKKIKIAAVVLVNPTYQGYAVDLKPIVNQFHRCNWPVLVDEAHGAHFSIDINLNLPRSALLSGADLVVHSLHKSASGLVQTSALWLNGDRVDTERIEKNISLLQTTSPSALFLASCESAISELHNPTGQKKLKKRIYEARQIYSSLVKCGLPLLKNQDPLKLILNTASVGVSGLEADKKLILRGIYGELPEPGSLTFCLGFSKHKGLVGDMKKAWHEFISGYSILDSFPNFLKPPFPSLTLIPIDVGSAWNENFELVHLSDAVHRVSSRMICPYPPGIPLVIPGEIFDERRVKWLLEQKKLWPDQIPSYVRVVN